MTKVLLIDKCEDCIFYLKHDIACNHPKMRKINNVEYQVYLSWYEDKMDANGFPIDCPLQTEQEYLDEKIMGNIAKALGESK